MIIWNVYVQDDETKPPKPSTTPPTQRFRNSPPLSMSRSSPPQSPPRFRLGPDTDLLKVEDSGLVEIGRGSRGALISPTSVCIFIFLKIRIAFFMLVSTKTEKRGSSSIVLPRKKECQEYLCETLKKRGVYMWRLINFKRKAGRGANHNERIKINGIFPIFL